MGEPGENSTVDPELSRRRFARSVVANWLDHLVFLDSSMIRSGVTVHGVATLKNKGFSAPALPNSALNEDDTPNKTRFLACGGRFYPVNGYDRGGAVGGVGLRLVVRCVDVDADVGLTSSTNRYVARYRATEDWAALFAHLGNADRLERWILRAHARLRGQDRCQSLSAVRLFRRVGNDSARK